MTNYLPVLTKVDFVRRYRAGEFGNASITWNTPQDLAKAKYKGGLVHLRSRIAGGPGAYNIGAECALHLWQDQPNPADFYVSAMAPHHKGTLQGECGYVGGKFTLTYNLQQVPMRDGFKIQTLVAEGIRAVGLMKLFMCPNSYEWSQLLLERYQGHVVEFSSFSIPWGTIPHHNSVFWEVRGGY